MGKTRAEIQRDYRARKLEKEGVKYLEKESKRVKGYYVPIAERSKADVKVRREKVRQWVAKHREVKRKKKEPMKKPSNEAVKEDANGVSSTVADIATTSGSLLVKFPFSPPPSERVHKSYVFVSDDGGHNAGTVFAFIKQFIPQLQADIGSVSCIHYWTDSPSSQYRNKTIFHVVSDHQNIFGVPAIWNYFEAGHGKGPCDGIGGTSKRMADLSVRQGKVIIQDASDYFAWGTKYHTSASYVFLTADDIAPMREELQDLTKSAKALKGTMTVHAVVGLSLGVILSRTTSCYCKLCLDGKYHTDWKRDEIKKPTNDVEGAQIPATDVTPEASGPDAAAAPADDPQHVMEEEPVQSDAPVQLDASVQPQRDQYVAAVYQQKWYIGKTKDVDSTECDCLVSFMENTSSKNINQFKWPKREDVIWVSFADILCVLSDPEPVGRYGRSFRFTTDELECVSRLFEQKV